MRVPVSIMLRHVVSISALTAVTSLNHSDQKFWLDLMIFFATQHVTKKEIKSRVMRSAGCCMCWHGRYTRAGIWAGIWEQLSGKVGTPCWWHSPGILGWGRDVNIWVFISRGRNNAHVNNLCCLSHPLRITGPTFNRATDSFLDGWGRSEVSVSGGLPVSWRSWGKRDAPLYSTWGQFHRHSLKSHPNS